MAGSGGTVEEAFSPIRAELSDLMRVAKVFHALRMEESLFPSPLTINALVVVTGSGMLAVDESETAVEVGGKDDLRFMSGKSEVPVRISSPQVQIRAFASMETTGGPRRLLNNSGWGAVQYRR